MAISRKKILSAKFKKAGSSGKKLHVISRQGDWVVFKEGSKRVISIYPTKKIAVLNGRKILNSSDMNTLVIHKTDGSVENYYQLAE